MADPVRSGFLARIDIFSVLGNLVQAAFSNWTAISSYISGGALMGYLAYLQDVKPLWFGAAILSGFLIVAIIRAINAYAQNQKADSTFKLEISKPPITANPLRSNFEQEAKVFGFLELLYPISALQGASVSQVPNPWS